MVEFPFSRWFPDWCCLGCRKGTEGGDHHKCWCEQCRDRTSTTDKAAAQARIARLGNSAAAFSAALRNQAGMSHPRAAGQEKA